MGLRAAYIALYISSLTFKFHDEQEMSNKQIFGATLTRESHANRKWAMRRFAHHFLGCDMTYHGISDYAKDEDESDSDNVIVVK